MRVVIIPDNLEDAYKFQINKFEAIEPIISDDGYYYFDEKIINYLESKLLDHTMADETKIDCLDIINELKTYEKRDCQY